MCVLVAVPMLLIENASQQRATEGAIEVLRKVTDDKTEVTNRLLANMVIGTTVTQLPNSPQQELLPPED